MARRGKEGGRRRRRWPATGSTFSTLQACTSLVAMAALSTASTVSLSDFGSVPSSAGAPIACILVYDQTIPDCTPRDFSKGDTCSSDCVAGLTLIQNTIMQVCTNLGVSLDSVLGQALQGNLVNLLCPATSTSSSKTPPTSTPRTQQAPTLAPLAFSQPTLSASSPTTMTAISNTPTTVLASTASLLPGAMTPTTPTTPTTSTTSTTFDAKSSSTSKTETTSPSATGGMRSGGGLGSPFDPVPSNDAAGRLLGTSPAQWWAVSSLAAMLVLAAMVW